MGIAPLRITPPAAAAAAAVAPVAPAVAASVAPLVITPTIAGASAVAATLEGAITSGAVLPSAAAAAAAAADGARWPRLWWRRPWRRRERAARGAEGHDAVAAQVLFCRVTDLVGILAHRLRHVRRRRRGEGHVQRWALEEGRRQPHVPIREHAVAERAYPCQPCQRQPTEEDRLVLAHVSLDPPPRRRLRLHPAAGGGGGGGGGGGAASRGHQHVVIGLPAAFARAAVGLHLEPWAGAAWDE
eukprot:scaffold21652_cov29-Phaeocystis_antarctica.AAC.1